MDSNGARELSRRLESQEHWRQAAAVQQGEQPAADPDGSDLVEMADGVRWYREESSGAPTNGAQTSATGRLCKRLVNGRWETSYESDGPE
jgi:hypothetical protein